MIEQQVCYGRRTLTDSMLSVRRISFHWLIVQLIFKTKTIWIYDTSNFIQNKKNSYVAAEEQKPRPAQLCILLTTWVYSETIKTKILVKWEEMWKCENKNDKKKTVAFMSERTILLTGGPDYTTTEHAGAGCSAIIRTECVLHVFSSSYEYEWHACPRRCLHHWKNPMCDLMIRLSSYSDIVFCWYFIIPHCDSIFNACVKENKYFFSFALCMLQFWQWLLYVMDDRMIIACMSSMHQQQYMRYNSEWEFHDSTWQLQAFDRDTSLNSVLVSLQFNVLTVGRSLLNFRFCF